MKVRVGSKYKYNPVMMDILYPASINTLKLGDIVKVVNKFGCPPANNMGHCYVEKDGEFQGLIRCDSLEKINEKVK